MEFNEVTIFFYGAPGEGFTAYPNTYLELAKGQDKSPGEYNPQCVYQLNSRLSIINYTEYNLTGIGNQGGIRGGRNFGIWIEIKNYKLTKSGQKHIVSFITDFVENGIVEKSGLFERDKHPKHYVVTSFNEVEVVLDKLLMVFKDKFIAEFSEHLTKINVKSEECSINLMKSETKNKRMPKPNVSVSDTTNFGRDITKTKNNQSSGRRSLTFQTKLDINTVLLVLIFIFLLVVLIPKPNNSNLEARYNEIAMKNKELEVVNNLLRNEIKQLQEEARNNIPKLKPPEIVETQSIFNKCVDQLTKQNPEMFYLSSSGNKLKFHMKHFRDSIVNRRFRFSSSDIVVKEVGELLNKSTINSCFVKNMATIKQNIKNNNSIYLKKINVAITFQIANNPSINTALYEDIQEVFDDDLVVLIDTP
jgi:hypothetical protein